MVVLLILLALPALGRDEHLYPIRPCMGPLHLVEYAAHCELAEVYMHYKLAPQRVPRQQGVPPHGSPLLAEQLLQPRELRF